MPHEGLRSAVRVRRRAHVHGAEARAVDEWRSRLDGLTQHEAAEHFSVAHNHCGGHGSRCGGSGVRRRCVCQRDFKLCRADDLRQGVTVVIRGGMA